MNMQREHVVSVCICKCVNVCMFDASKIRDVTMMILIIIIVIEIFNLTL